MKSNKRTGRRLKIRKLYNLKNKIKHAGVRKKAMGLIAFCVAFSLVLTGTFYNWGKARSDSEGAKAAELDALEGLPGVKFSSIKDSDIPNGMLLIGAYLIYDQYLTDAVYQLAVDSMTTYNQPIMFYKSSMAGGNWLDLSSAVGLSDLQGKTGDYVKKSELNDCIVCAMVDSDGKIRSLQKTGAGKIIFNIQDPYDFMELPELVPVKLLYSGLTEGVDIKWAWNISDILSKTDTGRIDQVYEKIWTARLLDGGLDGDSGGRAAMQALGNGHNETTDKLDKAISDLNNIYSYYVGQGNTQYMQTVMEAMGQADYSRRSEIYYMLAFNGMGRVYDYIVNKQYDKLITKEQWAEQFMIANWGENWRYNKKWSAAIDATLENNRNYSTWSSVNYEQMNKELVTTYQSMYGGLSDGEIKFLNASNSSIYGDKDDSANRLVINTLLNSSPNNEIGKLSSYKNKIDGSYYYSIAYLAYDYGWAVSQAGDRLADIRYWADRGDYDKAFENYFSLMQRTGSTREKGVDGTSDYYVVSNSGRLNSLLQRLETGDDLSPELRKTYTTDAEYTDSVKEAIQSCEESYYEYTSRLVENDNTLLGGTRYDTMQYLIDNADAQSKTSVSAEYNQKIMEYTCLRNIADNVIAERANELSLIDNTLMTKAENNYLKGIAAGPDKLYNDAVAANKPEEVLKGYLDNQKAALDGTLSEYEYMIDARIKRIALGDRIPYIDSLLGKANGYYNRVRNGAFSVKATKSVDEFIEWLNDLKGQCLAGSTGSLALDALESQKVNYEAEYMDALDKDDLDGAEKWKDALDDITAQITEIQDSALDSFLNGDAKGASDAANLLEGTPQALVEDIKGKAADDLEDGDLAMMDTYISALGDLGGSDALEYLDPLLKDAGASTELLNKLKDAKDVALGSAFNADGNGNGDETGNGNGTGTDGNGGRNGISGDDGTGTGGNGNGTGNGADGRDGSGNGTDGTGNGTSTGSNGTGGTGTGGNGTGTDGNGGRNGISGGNGTGTGGNGNGDGTGATGTGRNGTGTDGNGGRNGTGGNGSGNGSDRNIDTTGLGNKSDSKYDAYNDAIYDFFGKDFDDLSDKDKAETFAGIDQHANEKGDYTGKQFAKLLLKQLLDEGNPFIYQKYKDESTHLYVNMAAIDRCRLYTGYRYVYKNNMDTLSKLNSSASYMFTVGLSVVLKSDGRRAELTSSVVSQTDVTLDEKEKKIYPYLVKEDSEHYLDVSCYYIPNCIYAVLLPQDVDEKVEQFLGELDANSKIN